MSSATGAAAAGAGVGAKTVNRKKLKGKAKAAAKPPSKPRWEDLTGCPFARILVTTSGDNDKDVNPKTGEDLFFERSVGSCFMARDLVQRLGLPDVEFEVVPCSNAGVMFRINAYGRDMFYTDENGVKRVRDEVVWQKWCAELRTSLTVNGFDVVDLACDVTLHKAKSVPRDNKALTEVAEEMVAAKNQMRRGGAAAAPQVPAAAAAPASAGAAPTAVSLASAASAAVAAADAGASMDCKKS